MTKKDKNNYKKTAETLNEQARVNTAIATFICQKQNPYEAARQGSIDLSEDESQWGQIVFNTNVMSHQQWQEALADLTGFTHLWLIYDFHKNNTWNSKVLPPRGSDKKISMYATRSPYRPNFIGLSCVRLMKMDLHANPPKIFVSNFDLLNDTPIYDIKPYLPYADSVSDAKIGWLENIEEQKYEIHWQAMAVEQIQFLKSNGVGEIENFVQQQLSFEPTNKKKKRIINGALAYRTWRIEYTANEQEKMVQIKSVFSGYTAEELCDSEDKYQDKDLHRVFNKKYGPIF